MAEAAQPLSALDHPPGSTTTAGGVAVHGLFVRDLDGDLLIGPVSLDLPPGSLTILTGATPAGRGALVCALTGRLPLTRLRAHGTVHVGGHSAPPGIRNVSTLAHSWQTYGNTAVERRLQALAWAATRHSALICLWPGLEGLAEADRVTLLQTAGELRDQGVTLVLSAAARDLTGAEYSLADATINLDEHRW